MLNLSSGHGLINLWIRRRSFFIGSSFWFGFLVLWPIVFSSKKKVDPPNVLFIAIDDMNDWVGFLETHPQVKTPNLDALAEEGYYFSNAHCPAPICGPSRTAVLSGLWPTTSGNLYQWKFNYKNADGCAYQFARIF